MMRHLTVAAAASTLLLAACSSRPGNGGGEVDGQSDDLLAEPVDLISQSDLAVAVADLSDGYPAAPYGNTVGATFPPLAWEGYANPTATGLASQQPYGPYTMDDLRRSGARYALVHVSEFF